MVEVLEAGLMRARGETRGRLGYLLGDLVVSYEDQWGHDWAEVDDEEGRTAQLLVHFRENFVCLVISRGTTVCVCALIEKLRKGKGGNYPGGDQRGRAACTHLSSSSGP